MAARSRNSGSVFTAIVMAIYVPMIAVNLAQHEMWRDELQPWAVVMSSSSIIQLFDNNVYAGHPSLWYLILYAVSRFTANPVYMQVVHLGLASAAALVFLQYSPFTKPVKALFVFGYFPVYEYAAISRNYAVGLLLVFTICALLAARSRRYVLLSVLLAVLMQTSAYGFLLSLALVCYLAAEAYLTDRSRVRYSTLIWCAISVGMGALVAVATMKPPADSGFAVGWRVRPDLESLGRTLTAIWKAYVPVPRLGLHFWNTNLFPYRIQLLGSVLLLSVVLVWLHSKRTVLFAYVLGTAMMLTFIQVKMFGYLRHHGHLFVWLIVCLWLGAQSGESGAVQGAPTRSGHWPRLYQVFLTLLLVLHCGTGLYASGLDWFNTFSAGKAVAEFIRKRGFDTALLVGFNTVQTPAAYLGERYYNLNTSRYETYTIFDDVWARSQNRFGSESIDVAARLSRDTGRQVLFVLNKRIDDVSKYPLDPMAEFQNVIAPNEEFYLYLLRK